MRLTGGCLCEKMKYVSEGAPMVVGHCYCQDCRRASGTGHCTHVAVAATGFHAVGDIRFFAKPADSGNMVRRGFCPDCGTQLYSTNDATPGMVYIRASSLDEPDLIAPQLSVYAARAAAWDRPPGDLPAFAAMPPAGPPQALEA